MAATGIKRGACLFDVANSGMNGTLKNICLDLCVRVCVWGGGGGDVCGAAEVPEGHPGK